MTLSTGEFHCSRTFDDPVTISPAILAELAPLTEKEDETIAILVTAVFFSLMSVGMPACAEEIPTVDTTEQQTRQKDECMLAAKHCGLSVMSLQDKIEKLKDDIEKG